MSGDDGQLFRFRFGNDALGCVGDFSEARLELRVAGELRDRVQPLPLKVLGHLLRHANTFVSLDKLLREVWPAHGIERRAVYNAIDKLRDALGREGAAVLIENARGGYRFKGTVHARIPERAAPCGVAVQPGDAVPWRPEFKFTRRLGSRPGSQVWLVTHVGSGALRICKFCADADRQLDLRKEVALALVLRDRLGARDDIAQVIHWEFEHPPFFVESAYNGTDLVAWADESARLKRMPLADRVAIALAAAEAVSAAHGAGVVHMDIKPSNILAAPCMNGGWQVCVVDFGSGRSLDRAAIEKLQVQRLGLSVTQVVEGHGASGTADYTAPELRHGGEFVVPVLCDVYALGVVLYQLLAGDLRKPLAPGWERDIDDPFLREDVALCTDGSPDNRLQSASMLVHRLRTLDARRAAHAQALVQQERAAAQRIQAQIDADHRRRLEARRPWIVSTMALLVLGLGGAVWQWREADAARSRAESSAAQAEAVTRFLNEDVLGLADPYGAALPTPAIREAVQRTLSSVERAFPQQPRSEAAVRMTLAELLDKYGDPGGAEAQWRAATALLERLDGAGAPGTLQARYRTGAVIARAGKFDEAEAWLRQADREAGSSGAVDDPPTAVLAQHAWGLLHLTHQRLDLAAAPFERALAIATASPGAAGDALVDSIRHGLVTAYGGLGRFDESARVARDLLVSLERRPAVGELRLAAAQYDLGQALLYQGDLATAAPLVSSAASMATQRLGAGHPSVVMMEVTRCELLLRRSETEAALACALALHRAIRAAPATPQWMAWLMLGNAGVVQAQLDRHAEAAQSLGVARDGLARDHGPEPVRQYLNVNLAQARWRLGHGAAALPLMDGLDAVALLSIEPDVPWQQRIGLLRGLILADMGRTREATPFVERAIEELERAPPKKHEPLLAEARALLARRSPVSPAP